MGLFDLLIVQCGALPRLLSLLSDEGSDAGAHAARLLYQFARICRQGLDTSHGYTGMPLYEGAGPETLAEFYQLIGPEAVELMNLRGRAFAPPPPGLPPMGGAAFDDDPDELTTRISQSVFDALPDEVRLHFHWHGTCFQGLPHLLDQPLRDPFGAHTRRSKFDTWMLRAAFRREDIASHERPVMTVE